MTSHHATLAGSAREGGQVYFDDVAAGDEIPS